MVRKIEACGVAKTRLATEESYKMKKQRGT